MQSPPGTASTHLNPHSHTCQEHRLSLRPLWYRGMHGQAGNWYKPLGRELHNCLMDMGSQWLLSGPSKNARQDTPCMLYSRQCYTFQACKM